MGGGFKVQTLVWLASTQGLEIVLFIFYFWPKTTAKKCFDGLLLGNRIIYAKLGVIKSSTEKLEKPKTKKELLISVTAK